MTEDEAKNTVCPKMSGVALYDGITPDLFVVMCVASRCACWVWDQVYPDIEPGSGVVHVTTHPSTTDGHCGLIR